MKAAVRFALLSLAAIITGVTPGRGAYEPFALHDPSRRWSVNVGAREGYDVNVNTSSTQPESSSYTAIDSQLLVNFPQERTFMGLRYTYGATYYPDRIGPKVSQAHTADILFSHTFSSRLTLDAQDQVRRGVEPGLIEIQAGVPVELRRKGDFFYNGASTTLSCNLSRRWTSAVSAGWQFWRYDDASSARDNDRDRYYGSVTGSFFVDPQTSIGAQYQYADTAYRLSTFVVVPPFFIQVIPPEVRSSQSHIGSLLFVHRFNPQLSLQINGGLELQEFGDGTSSSAPSVASSVSYNYAPESALTVGFTYGLTTTDLAQFRNTESAYVFLQVGHRLTRKLRLTGTAAYNHAVFQNPTVFIPPPVPQAEDSMQLSLNANYFLTPWCSADLDYNYQRVDSEFPGRTFDRNNASLGVRVAY